MVRFSEVFFKIYLIYLLGYADPINKFFDNKNIIFLGDDASWF